MIQQLVGLFGHPVGHSMSPDMHNRAFQELGLAFHYAGFDVAPDQLAEAVTGIRALGFRGVNVTIPHKVAVMQYLDFIDDSAKLIGAVNTIVNDNGRLCGFNTDGDGYVRSLMEETGFEPSGKKVLIIGAGGAARGIISSLLGKQVSHIAISNRTQSRADELIEGICARYKEFLGSEPEAKLETILWEQARMQVYEFDCVINTTSVGMWPHTESMPIEGAQFFPSQIISDLVYNPLETKWLREARRLGATAHDGLGMFVYQGAIAFEKWTHHRAPVDVMRKIVQSKLENQANS